MTTAPSINAGVEPASAYATDQQQQYPTPAMGWLTVAILFLLYILSLTDRYIMALLVDPIKRDLGLSDFQISLLQGPAFATLFCLCAIPVGVALDRYSRRTVLYLSITLWSFAAAACGLASNFGTLFLARAAVGAGESGFGTGSYSIIGDSFPPQRVALAMSIFVMGGVMGAGIVFLLGGPIVAAVMKAGPAAWPIVGVMQPWQQVFIVTGVPGLAMAFLVFLFREPPRRARSGAASSSGYGEALVFIRARGRLFASIFLGFGLTYSVTIGLQLWTPSYFSRVHGWEPGRIGLVLGLAQILSATTLPLHGWIVDALYRRGKKDAHLFWCMTTGLLAAPCGIGAFMTSDPWLSVVLYGLYMAFILSTASNGPAVVQVLTPQSLRGRVSAVYVLFTGLLAMAGGPALVGLLTDKVLGDESKVGTSLMLTIICVLLPAMALLAMGRAPMRREMSEQGARAVSLGQGG